MHRHTNGISSAPCQLAIMSNTIHGINAWYTRLRLTVFFLSRIIFVLLKKLIKKKSLIIFITCRTAVEPASEGKLLQTHEVLVMQCDAAVLFRIGERERQPSG